MKVLFYSAKDFEHSYIVNANTQEVEVSFTSKALSLESSNMAKGFDCISIFTADDASAVVIDNLYNHGVKYIAIRAAGYDNVDLKKASSLGLAVANVPGYSPYAIAEHAVAMMLALNRKLILANRQVQQQNFTFGHVGGFK